MTTQDPTINENEVPTNTSEVAPITQSEASTITDNESPAKSAEAVPQSAASPEPSKEQVNPQVNAAPGAYPIDDSDDYPKPYPMDEELKSGLNAINGILLDVGNLIWLAAAEPTLASREIQFKDALAGIDDLREMVLQAINLNARQKQAEDLTALDAFAKGRGYRNWDEMRKAMDGDDNDEPQSPAQPTAKRKRSVKDQPKVFKWVLREDAPNVTTDDPPGYVRLPKELQDSGKYRLATANEIKRFEADLAKWKADQLLSKKP